MAKRKPDDGRPPKTRVLTGAQESAASLNPALAQGAVPAPGEPSGRPPALLGVCMASDACDCVERASAGIGGVFERAATLAEARVLMASGSYDVVILDDSLPDGCGFDLVREYALEAQAPVCFVVLSDRTDMDAAVEAMRNGAADFLSRPFAEAELSRRIAAAAERSRRLRDGQRRVERLKRICRRLNTAREEVSRQVDTLCNDLVTAYQDLADQMQHATMASEFSALVRQELDVESLLRTTLEYLLSKTGPTNAAVFLPTGHSDYSLGAYVNYDVPRDTADVLLDHLADIIAPRFEDEDRVRHFPDPEALRAVIDDDAAWLDDSAAVVFACRDSDADCLAVFCLFRDRRNPYSQAHLDQLLLIRDVFAEQLERVVRIHHRHTPEKQWPGFDIEGENEEDDRGLAA